MKSWNKIYYLLFFTNLFMFISCEGLNNKKPVNKVIPDDIEYTHYIKLVSNWGEIFLSLDSTFNEVYLYLKGDCTEDYYEHVIKNRTSSKIRRDFLYSGFKDTVHYLIFYYNAYKRDSITEINLSEKIETFANWYEYEELQPLLNNINGLPFITIKKVDFTVNEHYELIKYNTMIAQGSINIELLTNLIPDSLVEKYFYEILNSTYIKLNPDYFKNHYFENTEDSIIYTDSLNKIQLLTY